MFDDSTHGERLAWICLLCHAKSQGRGGKVRFRKNAFQTAYRLSERSVEGMIERARKCAAIAFDGEVITLCNWKVYQQKAWSAMPGNDKEKPETEVNPATKHQAPTTQNQAPSTPKSSTASPRPADEIWDAVANRWFEGKVIPSQRKSVGRIVQDFKDLGATPAEIAVRADRLSAAWGEAKCTARSLVAHWGKFDHDPAAPSRNGVREMSLAEIEDAFRE